MPDFPPPRPAIVRPAETRPVQGGRPVVVVTDRGTVNNNNGRGNTNNNGRGNDHCDTYGRVPQNPYGNNGSRFPNSGQYCPPGRVQGPIIISPAVVDPTVQNPGLLRLDFTKFATKNTAGLLDLQRDLSASSTTDRKWSWTRAQDAAVPRGELVRIPLACDNGITYTALVHVGRIGMDANIQQMRDAKTWYLETAGTGKVTMISQPISMAGIDRLRK